MKKLLSTVAVLALCTTPAMADHMMHNGRHVMHHTVVTPVAVATTTTTNTYKVERPLTYNEVLQRRAMQTEIEREMKRADLNIDHQVTYDEYSFGERVLQRDNLDPKASFDMIDTNKDGILSSQEVMDSRWAAMTEADKVKVTRTEETYVRNMHY